MAYPGQPGQPGGQPPPPPYPPPYGAPPGGFAYQLSPAELRHPLEIPVMAGSWAVVLLLLVLFGALFNVLIEGLIIVALIGATLYFSAIANLGNAIQVGPQQLPQLHQLANEAAYRLSMPVPEVYVRQNPFLEAEAQDMGRKQGVVSLSTAMVEQFTPAELQFLLARQFGHVKCRHTSWSILHGRSAGGLLGGLGAALRSGLLVLFSWWNRTMELTADRAGLIAGQDIRAAMTAILKEMVGPQVFARLNIPALLEQMNELEGSQLARVAQGVGVEMSPFALNRIRELLRFYKSPLYQNLAARQGKAGTTMLQSGPGIATGQLFHTLAHQAQAQRAAAPGAEAGPGGPEAPTPPASVCRACGQPLRPGGRFCGACGTPRA